MKLSEQISSAVKADDWDSFLAEGAKYPVGTVRDWKRGGTTVQMKKAAPGKWVPASSSVKSSSGGGAEPDKAAIELATAESLLGGMYKKETATVDGKELRLNPEFTSKTPKEHKKIAETFLAAHANALSENVGALKELFPNAYVKGRVKTLPSALTKLVRKPSHILPDGKTKGYASVSDLDDGTGVRAIFGTIQEVKDAVRKLKLSIGADNVVSEDDYLGDSKSNKNYPYRSHHMIIRRNGLRQEVQIRTKNQEKWGNWYHDVYKPRSPEQKANFEANKGEIDKYAREISDHFDAVDSGKKSTEPKCPDVVRDSPFGCLKT